MALRALILQAGHDIWVEESTATRAIVKGVRAGSKHEQQSVWTLDRAKLARLMGKPNWQAHPGAMLVARATAECARLIAPDVLLGLPYIVEEAGDGEVFDETEVIASAAPPKKRTAQRRTRIQKEDPAPVEAEVAEEVAEVESLPLWGDGDDKPAEGETYLEPPDDWVSELVEYASPAQLEELRRTLKRVRLPADRWLEVIGQTIGREVEALEELYPAEAAGLVDEWRGKLWKGDA
jgi:hypothetical protein